MFRPAIRPALQMSLLMSLLLARLAFAAPPTDVMMYKEGDRIDPREVARILAAPEPSAQATEEPIRTRSIRMLVDKPADKATSPGPLAASDAGNYRLTQRPDGSGAATPPPNALALPIQFAFGSAEILPSARSQIEALAEGIRYLEPTRHVTIEGHTDAAGGEQYNLQLSQRRALAVKNYLVSNYGISPNRLEAIGMGEYRLINEQDPYAAENRRVQFHGG